MIYVAREGVCGFISYVEHWMVPVDIIYNWYVYPCNNGYQFLSVSTAGFLFDK